MKILSKQPNECNRCKDKSHKRKNYLWLEELVWLPALWQRKSIPQRFEHYIASGQRLNLELRHQGPCLLSPKWRFARSIDPYLTTSY